MSRTVKCNRLHNALNWTGHLALWLAPNALADADRLADAVDRLNWTDAKWGAMMAETETSLAHWDTVLYLLTHILIYQSWGYLAILGASIEYSSPPCSRARAARAETVNPGHIFAQFYIKVVFISLSRYYVNLKCSFSPHQRVGDFWVSLCVCAVSDVSLAVTKWSAVQKELASFCTDWSAVSHNLATKRTLICWDSNKHTDRQ